MSLPESFRLDHRKVRAPYVRLAGVRETPRGDRIEKYDLRLAQPNLEALDTGSLHTLEHLLATYLRGHLEGVVDVSPMGCRTGFYLVVLGEPGPARVLEAFRASLEQVALHTDVVPGASELECGNYRDHNLEGAKAWARRVLDQGLRVQETVEISD
ncbi:MAG: S-ribosylhomocysteine lyase [Meiothermus sp.]|uniref:S-ribosylhomocysteine lyase n=1 Tax=Meiothermus sp. TaxID=1955249 RepID=UPI0025DA2B05|nr:S-ribosylhomocysteine lyase [Meiothermus sp.]MCS7059108.1 S-ribosylhomocysteine lyase [Meiothermus sp.]MCS7195520.1 S-ribosylhomocysteine lyase [Meiothermus sp.]MCX7741581.1 S-ribosylhomocysteine lyase [Meiothermus sp.]MDW8090448.1 S-ribosylhomocysteine lyase [Meiothermus sp.]